MLTPAMIPDAAAASAACGAPSSPGDLKDRVYDALAATLTGAPLAPAREGRICSEGSPCLAVP